MKGSHQKFNWLESLLAVLIVGLLLFLISLL